MSVRKNLGVIDHKTKENVTFLEWCQELLEVLWFRSSSNIKE